MRILFCNYEYPPLGGGGGVINALLAEQLAKKHHICVLTSQGLGLPRQEQVSGVNIIRVPVFFRTQQAAANMASMLAYLPMGIYSGRRLLKQQSFDIINTHFVLPTGPVGDYLSRFSGLVNVLSVHGGDLYDPSKASSPHNHALLRAWVRRLLRRADAVVGQSKNTIQNVHDYYDSQLVCDRIPLGIKRPSREQGNRADYGFSDTDVLMVTVGRIVARKAIDQLLKVMRQLKNPRTYLLVIGSGPLQKTLQAQAQQLGIANKVQFVGQVEEAEKLRLLNMADIFVSTSQHEGFGMVYLEGMTCGLPVICYDYGGQTDFLENKQTGYVVKLNDLKAFTQACEILLDHLDKRSEMGNYNLQKVEELFIDHCAERYEELFESVLQQKQQKAVR